MPDSTRRIWEIWEKSRNRGDQRPQRGFLAAFLALSLPTAVWAGPPREPWPFWGRTATREGNTATIGPRTPTIEWWIDYDPTPYDHIIGSSGVLDREGRLFQGRDEGITVIDTIGREILWLGDAPQIVSDAPTVVDRRVYWGWTTDGHLVCSDAAAGDPIWELPSAGGFDVSPVVDSRGVIYFLDRFGVVYARDAATGEEVWTQDLDELSFGSPTLVEKEHLLVHADFDAQRLDPSTGALGWSFHTFRELFGYVPYRDGRFYIGARDENLYCVDAATGEEIWRFFTDQFISGCVALGHDETVYVGTGGGDSVARLFSLTIDGAENWRIDPNGLIVAPPMIAGDATIYFASTDASTREGFVNAVMPDGTWMWLLEMPDMVSASPVLGPDGTLYITCRDDNIYAFRDPHTRADLTNLDITTGDILEGNIASLNEVDENILRIRSGFGARLSDLHKMELTLSAHIDDLDPNFDILRLQIKTWIDQPTGVGTVQLKNWNTNQFDTVRTYVQENKPFFEWIQIPTGGNTPHIDPRTYVRLSGAVEMKLRNVVFAPFLAFRFETTIEQVKIEVTSPPG